MKLYTEKVGYIFVGPNAPANPKPPKQKKKAKK